MLTKRAKQKKPTPASRPRETALYPPIKAFLEQQGYEVKAEVGKADVVARRPNAPDDDPVIVELKTGFTLTVLQQAIDRLSLSEAVYIAVPDGSTRTFAANLRANLKLCRRLGLGLMTVRLSDGHVTAHLDPGPYKPRQHKPRKSRLLREFARRVGDPNKGGATRRGIVTSYRQDALKVVAFLSANGPTKAASVAAATGVANARRIMSDDHYGWFERESVGIYRLTPNGRKAIDSWGLPESPPESTIAA